MKVWSFLLYISDNSLLLHRTKVKFDGQCLKQDKVTFTHKKVVNIYPLYKINLWSFRRDDDFTLGNGLFGAVKVTKNDDKDKYKHPESWNFFIVKWQKIWQKCNNFRSRYELYYAFQQQKEGYFNPWKRTNRWMKWSNANCRKRVLD